MRARSPGDGSPGAVISPSTIRGVVVGYVNSCGAGTTTVAGPSLDLVSFARSGFCPCSDIEGKSDSLDHTPYQWECHPVSESRVQSARRSRVNEICN